MTNLLVAGGTSYLFPIEIIDLKSSSTTCKSLPPLSLLGGAFGGLGPKDNPVICNSNFGYNECFIYKNNAWNQFPFLSSIRTAAAISPSPYPNKSHKFIVTGGWNYSNNTTYQNTGEILTDDGWKPFPVLLPVKIAHHCMVLINSTTVLVIGGSQFNSSINLEPYDRLNPPNYVNTFFFNSDNEKWTQGLEKYSVPVSFTSKLL